MRIVQRSEWGAKHGQGNPTAGAKLALYLHHTVTTDLLPTSTLEAESARVRAIEEEHAAGLTKLNPRIGYSFLVAPSGRAFEGCGWDRIGAHTENRNSSSYGVALMMNGELLVPTPQAVQAVNELRVLGVRLGKLRNDHAYLGHRDAKATLCPGKLVYACTIAIANSEQLPVVRGGEATAAMPTLRKGAGGNTAPADLVTAVRELQRLLRMPGTQQTGYFGDATDAAVRDFQRSRGLLDDGVVGRKTWDMLLP